jgi:hypothetical protein
MMIKHLKSLVAGLLTHFKFKPNFISVLSLYSRFVREANSFIRLGGKIDSFAPRLFDYADESGVMSGAYFHHDLVIAQDIFVKSPKTHVDIGSRIDGFVAHVASFREVTIFDIREFAQSDHPNIIFQQVDFMDNLKIPQNFADSVSCLNTLEHFGLGRYNDPIDPDGHIKGFHNLISVLEMRGTLYVSIPVSLEPKLHFNSHRVFHPNEIFAWVPIGHQLDLVRFDYVNDEGRLFKNMEIKNIPSEDIMGHGIYTFTKVK